MTKASVKSNPDRKLNCIGLFCPESVIKTSQELDKMMINEILEALADDLRYICVCDDDRYNIGDFSIFSTKEILWKS